MLGQEYARTIDMLVTDVVMPKLSGRELAEKLKEIRPNLSILFMSGYPDGAIVHHGVLDEGLPFIPKPFDTREFLIKVREVLDGEEEASP